MQKPIDNIHSQNMDPSLIRTEVWNPYKYPIILRLQLAMLDYLRLNGRQTHIREVLIKPNHSVILTHQYWDVECNGIKDNSQIFLPQNLGRDIGKGIRWLPGPTEAGHEQIKKIIQTVNNG